MAIDLAELTPYDIGWTLRAGTSDATALHTRRAFLGKSLLLLVAMAAYRAFERPAMAHTTVDTYEDYRMREPLDDCGGDYANCGGCNTLRKIGGCCTGTSTACPKGAGWHKHDHANGYGLRTNVCNASPWDGWTWKWNGCCYNAAYGEYREQMRWRCHDGYINSEKSICRWVIGNGISGLCPN